MAGQFLKRMGAGLLVLLAGRAFAGELPSVTFSGAEFIRTDVVPTVDMRVVCDFQLLELPQGNNVAGVFGSLGTAANNISVNTGWGFRAQGPNNAGMGGWAGKFIGWSGNDGQPMAPIDLARHLVELASGRVVLDGQTNTCGAARDPSTTNGGSLGRFDVADQGWHGMNGLARVRIFKLQFFRTAGGVETCVRDYVPYEQDGFYGLYDKVGGTFLSAIGTRTAMAGVWTRHPSVTPRAWDRRAGATPAIDLGEVQSGATVTCSHTAAQLAALPVGSHRVTFTTVSDDPALDGKTVTEVVTVREPLRGTLSADGQSLALTFPPSAVARTLRIAYGATDAGDDPAAWEHEETVEVPANTDALTVSVPAGVGPDAGVWSVFFAEPAGAKSALSYVRHNNLIAQWDGVENAAYGTHDGARTAPVEIRRGLAQTVDGTLPGDDSSFALGNGYIRLDAPVLRQALNGGHATVELVMTDANGAYVANGGLFCQGWNSRGFWVYQGGGAFVEALSYHAQVRNEYDGFAVRGDGKVNTYSFVLGENADRSRFTVNGTARNRTYGSGNPPVEAKIRRFGTDATDSQVVIGRLPSDAYWGSNLRPRGKVFSIRVYDQVLTEEELAANRAIDQARFGGVEKVGPFYAKLPLTVGKVVKENKQPVSAELSFGGSDRPRRLYLAWDAKDGGEKLEGWANQAFVCDVPAGTSRLTAEIPAAARAALAGAGGFRFMLEDPVTAASYAQPDHLVAQFDGVENAGFGVHEAGRTCPVELRHDLTLTATGPLADDGRAFTLGTNSFSFACPALRDAVNAGHATVELVMATNGLAGVNNGGFFCQGWTTRGFWFYQKTDHIGDVSYHAKITGEYNEVRAAALTGTNTVSFVLGGDTASSFVAQDGVRKAGFNRYATDADDQCYVGVLPSPNYYPSNLRARMKIYSIRLYDCVLTEAERTANSDIDSHRFRGQFSCYAASGYVSVAPKGIVVLVR